MEQALSSDNSRPFHKVRKCAPTRAQAIEQEDPLLSTQPPVEADLLENFTIDEFEGQREGEDEEEEENKKLFTIEEISSLYTKPDKMEFYKSILKTMCAFNLL